MRTYYRHARVIYRRAALLMEHLPAPVSFYRQFRRRRTPIAGTDFILDQGRIDILPGAQFSDTAAILRIFSLMATHGYTLSQAAEDRITDALPALAIHIPEGPYLWNSLREVLLGPHAAHALRTMHALGVLEMLIPEFHGIDALVIRDSYHRYTVDEHTFLIIDNVHGLRQPTHDYEQRLAQLLPEIDRLDLFLLSLLLHDTGKARRSGEHTGQSVELADSFMARLDFDTEERESVLKLIRMHLEMSNALRRDIFDLENVRGFAEKIGSPALLKMLTLHDLCRHQGRQSRGADAMEGGKPLAALHGHGQLHGPQRGRDPLSRSHRSHAAQSHPLDGSRQPVRRAPAVPRRAAAALSADPPPRADPQSLPARRQPRQGSRPTRSSSPPPALRSHRDRHATAAACLPTWPAPSPPGA